MVGQALSVPRSLGALFEIGVAGDLPDGQLLERFTSGHREAAELAFQALVERHGPMVLRVCRRLLDDPNDAEDAFQATFLVLLRRAASIRDRGSVAAWLHGVALRVASRARVESARRRRIERHGIRPELERNADPDRLDLASVIDEELARLPEKYRAPIVLCYLEGLTHEGAADRLGWPVGTVRGRLSRARDLLRARLTRCGVTASAALAAVGSLAEPAQAVVPAALREATVRAAAEIASGRAIAAAVSARRRGPGRGGLSPNGLDSRGDGQGALILLGAIGMGLTIFANPPSPRQPPQAVQAPPPDSRETVRREMLRLKGTWSSMQTEESTINGVPQPPKRYKMIWSIDRDKITVSDSDGFAGMTYRYSLGLDPSPKTIDLTCLNLGMTLHGLYRLEGDTMTLCMGVERPRGLEEGPGHFRVVFQRESRTPTELSPEYPNAPGCYWAVEPKGSVPRSMNSGGINWIARKDPQGAMVVTLAFVTKVDDGKPMLRYRPVAYDDKRTRYLLTPGQGGGSGSASIREAMLVLREFRLDPAVLPFERAKRLGIEVVPTEARQASEAVASARASKEARAAGIEILPWPQIGKPFAFELTDTKGRAIRSADLKGKVVLIDCWAGWCSPCMAKMPRLKALYALRHADGLEVIGLNFDKDRARAEALVKSLDVSWSDVYVPADDRTRDLWADGAGISGLPRLFLIDRQGILRWDGGPHELEKRVTELLK